MRPFLGRDRKNSDDKQRRQNHFNYSFHNYMPTGLRCLCQPRAGDDKYSHCGVRSLTGGGAAQRSRGYVAGVGGDGVALCPLSGVPVKTRCRRGHGAGKNVLAPQEKTKYFSNAMTVTKDKYITIEYSFSTSDGTLLGSSEYSGPFTFRQGYGDVVPGLDSRVEGAEIGDELSFVIPPEEGYGERDESKVKRLPLDALPLGRDPEPGLRVNLNGTVMVITEVHDDHLTLDGNHPLAGIPLHFNLRVTEVSDEAPEEHGGCGCGGTCSC